MATRRRLPRWFAPAAAGANPCGAAGEAGPPPPAAPDILARYRAAAPARHAVVVVLDTLRADVAASAATPTLDALAADGARAAAWAPGTWTVPSTFSLLTGASVRRHGWDEPTGHLGRYPPLPALDTLATVLRAAGFATAAWTANPYVADAALGFQRGFGTWHRSADRAMPGQFARHVAETWGDGRRHFAYLHFIATHSPLRPSEAARRRHGLDDAWFDDRQGLAIGAAKRGRPEGVREAYRAAYAAVAEDVDARLGEVLEALGAHRADTFVLVTSDHGEMLGEHGFFGHGSLVWDPVVRVPLVVDHPGLPGEAEALPAAVSTVAVPALVTAALGVAHDWPGDEGPPLVSQREGQLALSLDGRAVALWARPGAGVRGALPPPESPAVYDLEADPAQARPLPADDPRVASLARARAAWEAAVPAGRLDPEATVTLPEKTREELRALGYLDPEGAGR